MTSLGKSWSAATVACARPEHAGSRARFDGRYGTPGHQRQRYRCVPANSDPPHRFTELLPREESWTGACEACERSVRVHEGPHAARHCQFVARGIAGALKAVGAGSSYREAAFVARERGQRMRADPQTGEVRWTLVLLQCEISRARHASGLLVLAYVDVDGLKHVNDSLGHAAGDALLRVVVTSIQRHLRSYDPIVRVGGDEFVCALANTTPDEAGGRFRDIAVTIRRALPEASISVGFAALQPDDTLDTLTKRGDLALYEAKRSRRD